MRAQAGLSWSTVLKKREGCRRAFSEFDPLKVARYTQKRIHTGSAHRQLSSAVSGHSESTTDRRASPSSRPPLTSLQGSSILDLKASRVRGNK